MCYGICPYEDSKGECMLGLLEMEDKLPEDAACNIDIEEEEEDERI